MDHCPDLRVCVESIDDRLREVEQFIERLYGLKIEPGLPIPSPGGKRVEYKAPEPVSLRPFSQELFADIRKKLEDLKEEFNKPINVEET